MEDVKAAEKEVTEKKVAEIEAEHARLRAEKEAEEKKAAEETKKAEEKKTAEEKKEAK